MYALVTGGAGFIGSHVVQALSRRNREVRVFDNLSTGSLANLEGLPIDFRKGDIRNPDELATAMEGAEFVYHFAAFISAPDSVTQPEACYQTNILGSLSVLQAAQQAGVKRVVLASSAAVYGDTEDAVPEDAPKNPASPYAVSKLAMEETARLYSRTYGLETVCLRFFNVYGPGQSPDSAYAAVIPQFISDLDAGIGITILGDGGQTRDFIYVDDVAEACLLAMEHPDAAGGTFNIAGGRSISILDLAGILQGFYSEAPEVQFGPSRPGDVRLSLADIGHAQAALGYRPKTALVDGLAQTVEWFRRRHTE
ncbi:MAG: NAD-dependent epimerase/dehydratase family protein [Anaerolineales bacterium]